MQFVAAWHSDKSIHFHISWLKSLLQYFYALKRKAQTYTIYRQTLDLLICFVAVQNQ